MKYALKILGLGFLLVPAVFSVEIGSPCVCRIQCDDGSSLVVANTTVAYCCKTLNDYCGEDGGNASCSFEDGRVNYCAFP